MAEEATSRVLLDEVDHYISKALTQQLERTTAFYASKPGIGIDDKTKFSKL